jgi:hypothetical protein
MRKIIEQAVVTLDGQVSTPQDWLPTRWAGEFEQLSKGPAVLRRCAPLRAGQLREPRRGVADPGGGVR